MRAIVAILTCAIMLLAQPALAQDPYQPDRILHSVETDDLVAIVQSLGDAVEEKIDEDRLIIAQTPDGLRYILIGTACDIGGISGCQGLMIQLRYDVPQEATIEGVNQANINEAAILTWMAEDRSTLAFVRYVILDHGISMANLRENIIVLGMVAPAAMAHVKGEAQ